MEGRDDYWTVFKNLQVTVNDNNDLLVRSIVVNLAIRGFALRDQVLSYKSKKHKNYIAIARRPISCDAIIPFDDLEEHARITLKIWPTKHLS